MIVSAAAEEWLLYTLGLTSIPLPAAQEAVALENVDAGFWKRKEADWLWVLVLLVQGFLFLNLCLRLVLPEGRAPPILSLEDSAPKTLI